MHLNDHFFIKTSIESCLQNRFQINETLYIFHLQVNEILKCVYMLSTFTNLHTISIIYQTSNLKIIFAHNFDQTSSNAFVTIFLF
jgi:hypothetical protein